MLVSEAALALDESRAVALEVVETEQMLVSRLLIAVESLEAAATAFKDLFQSIKANEVRSCVSRRIARAQNDRKCRAR